MLFLVCGLLAFSALIVALGLRPLFKRLCLRLHTSTVYPQALQSHTKKHKKISPVASMAHLADGDLLVFFDTGAEHAKKQKIT